MGFLSENYKSEKLLFLEDSLYSNAPNIEQIRARGWDFILGVKPEGNKYLFKLFEARLRNGKLIKSHRVQDGTCHYEFHFFNNVSINESNPGVKVNFLYCQQTCAKGKKTVFSWVTWLVISNRNVLEIARAGRSRWKIENETARAAPLQHVEKPGLPPRGRPRSSTVMVTAMSTFHRCSRI